MDNFSINLFFHPCADQNLSNEDRAKHYFKNEWTLCKYSNPNFHSAKVICTLYNKTTYFEDSWILGPRIISTSCIRRLGQNFKCCN